MAVGALSTFAARSALSGAGGQKTRPGARQSEVAAWLSALSFAGLGRPAGSHPDWERDATCSARAWLRLVDDDRHFESWSEAASLLREEVSPRDWAEALRRTRAPLGRCLCRKPEPCAAVEGPPGERRGPYVVTRFESVFERRGHAIETVTAMRGPDGRWRVAAYFIG